MPIDKRVATAADALQDTPNGALVFISGFGGAGFPNVLIRALRDCGPRELTLIVNSATHRFSYTHELIEAGMVRKVICSAARGHTKDLSPFEQLYKDGLQRERFLPAIELLRRHVDVLHLDGGTDYRLRQLEQAPTYLDTSRESLGRLQSRFAALAGDTATGPRVLSIEERSIAALATGAGMAWFEFSELCEGPRSQNDYIELARSYHTIFISNIPVFTAADEDAARRFVMLIDEFYDRGVKIVVSAAAPPAALYRGARLQLEFQRAASRLIEMQTQRYLSGQHRS